MSHFYVHHREMAEHFRRDREQKNPQFLSARWQYSNT